MDIESFIKILIILSVVKGFIGFFIYLWLAHGIKKELAGFIVFFIFSIVPFLAWHYSGGEMLEKMAGLAIWAIESFISLFVGVAFIFLYEHITGKTREEIYA